jgi:hypothetical protein
MALWLTLGIVTVSYEKRGFERRSLSEAYAQYAAFCPLRDVAKAAAKRGAFPKDGKAAAPHDFEAVDILS